MKYLSYAVGGVIGIALASHIGWPIAILIGIAAGAGMATILVREPSTSSSNGRPQHNLPDHCWEAALAEFEEGNRKHATWAKALADTNGNDAAAKAAYIKIRAQELYDEEIREEVQRRARASSGTCPNCGNRVSLSADRCYHCNSHFLGAFRPRPLDNDD